MYTRNLNEVTTPATIISNVKEITYDLEDVVLEIADLEEKLKQAKLKKSKIKEDLDWELQKITKLNK